MHTGFYSLKATIIYLLVSIGATASFFTGFCVLGIIEIAYFFHTSTILAYDGQKS